MRGELGALELLRDLVLRGGCRRIGQVGVEDVAVRADLEVTQGQAAATVAQLLGLDWCAAEPRARKPLPGVR